MYITPELIKKFDEIKLRFLEMSEQFDMSVASVKEITETQKRLLSLIEMADENTKTSLELFVAETKKAIEKTTADIEKSRLRYASIKRLEEALEKATDEEKVLIYDVLVAAGVEKPIEDVYREEPLCEECPKDEQLTLDLDFENCVKPAIENVEEGPELDLRENVEEAPELVEETAEDEEHEVVEEHEEE